MKNKIYISSLIIFILTVTILPTTTKAEIKPDAKIKPNTTNTKQQKPIKGINGVIKSITSDTIFVEGKTIRDTATSTYTVKTDSGTTYRGATSILSLSSLAVGQNVVIVGEAISATSTTITAKNVMIIDPSIRNRQIENQLNKASSTEKNTNGMFHKMLNWLRNKFK